MMELFGIDVSKYNGTINWDVVAAHTPKVEFAGIRIGASWGYIDTQFQRNWAGAKAHNIARTAYHVLYPGQDVQRQMDNLFSALPPNDIGELPISLDLELALNQTKARVTTDILQAAAIILNRTGRNPIMYSRAGWIDQHTDNRNHWRDNFDWWLAHYGYQNAPRYDPPMLPLGVSRERCIIHQYTSIGEPFGVESKALDYNRWQFDLDHLNAYIGKEIEPQPDIRAKLTRAIETINVALDDLADIQEML